ncbi:hypothetical protein [Nocardia asiatica]|uniref:hypothetical protein n=1 Tax=Nocardia asiatica TaxID=209252 RepID=UPI003EDFE47A
MPAGVGVLGTAQRRGRLPITPLGGQFRLDRPAPLLAALRPDPFRELALRGDLAFGQHFQQRRIELQGQFAARGLDLLSQRGNLGTTVRGFVGHREPSQEQVSCRGGGDMIARTYV